ncbi:MAG: ribonuclease Z [Bacteroidales bacterium]|nr:ribonuclease Z [Bacteroidales bacterium]
MTVNILGCGSATPSLKHLPACQVVEHNGTYYMVDCGEGAQLSVRKAGIKMGRLRHIFISHLHGDHILGLTGLLASLALHEFGGTMHVYMLPEGIEVIKQSLKVFAHEPDYELVFHPLEVGKNIIYENEALQVETFPLYHGVPAVGFIFREKPKKRPLRGDVVEHYQVPIKLRPGLKDGADFVTDDGRVIPNSWLTTDPMPPVSYAYASDTKYDQRVVEAVKGVDVLFHEATYADDKAANAAQRGHSTARQAGIAARQAEVGRLIIGHFSKAYNSDESPLLNQAREEFPNTILAHEGLKITI